MFKRFINWLFGRDDNELTEDQWAYLQERSSPPENRARGRENEREVKVYELEEDSEIAECLTDGVISSDEMDRLRD